MRSLAWVLLLAAAGCDCQSSADESVLPGSAAKRQKSLAERIVERSLFEVDPDPVVQADVSLALGEVVLAGDVPHLRLIVAGKYPILAKGAAQALVRIRLAREPQKHDAVLQECIKTETDAYVKAECVAEAAPKKPSPPPNLAQLAEQLQAEDVEVRRAAARAVIALPDVASTNDPKLQSALYHGLFDSDSRFRLLVSAVYLRRSIATDPFAEETGE